MKATNAHGEVNFYRLPDDHPDLNLEGFEPHNDRDNQGQLIVGHSESGHNHVLERAAEPVIQQAVIDGMKVFFAILKEPTRLLQTAGHSHKEQILESGRYVITNNVDYNPFTEQAKRVAD